MIPYRSEIDGLRAVAVIAVIIFHLKAAWLPGGFTGVDVFFALSGFLITSIIIREKELGQFSLKAFYVRRMKRILPPLYVMAFVVLFVGIFILTGRDYGYLKDSLHYMLLFGSNIYFAQGGDYFGLNSAEMPLLHTWSLAVEEQIYLVWPFLVLLFYRMGARWKAILWGLGVIASFSYAEYVLSSSQSKTTAYYSFWARYGEVLLGAGVAIICANRESYLNRLGKRTSFLMSAFGASLLAVSFVFVTQNSRFPGIQSLPAVLGTLFLIVGMKSHDGMFKYLFSSRPLKHVGKISYSLYLWHWPILAFMKYMYGMLGLPLIWMVLALVLTYVFAASSYYLVEQAVRVKEMTFSKALASCLIIPSLVIVLSLQGASALSDRSERDLRFTRYGGDEVCHLKLGDQCIRGDTTKTPKILIFGDSHAAHLHHFIDRLGSLSGWSAMLISASACGPAFDFDIERLRDYAKRDCGLLLEHVQKNFTAYDTIVLAARWESQFNVEPTDDADPQFKEKFLRTLEILKNQGARVVVVSQVPSLNTSPARAEKAIKLGIPVTVEYNSYFERGNELLREVASEAGVEFMDITFLVKELADGLYLNGHAVYMDYDHLNQYGAEELAARYFKSPKALDLAQ